MPTPDILDARIRSLVTELIESSPPAPLLPQLEWGDAHPSAFVPHRFEGRPAPRWPRRPGLVPVLLSTVVVLGALAGIATLVAVAPRSRPPAALGQTHHLRPSDQPPAAVTGNEETLLAVSVPAFFYRGQSVAENCWIGVGTPQSFTVDGTPPFVSWSRSGENTPACPNQPAAVLTYEGNGLGNGTGIDSEGPATQSLAGTATAVFVVPQWPVAGKTVYVWSDLPPDVAYVTYSFEGATPDWEVPDGGVAAFLVPQLFALEAPFSVWHTTPLPVLSAYDASGTLIGTVYGPRVGGDDFGMSPTGAG